MKRAIRMAEFATMPRPQQDEMLRDMVDATKGPPNGECAAVDVEIRAFEQRHGFDSDTMRAKLRDGSLAENWDICQWLMALNLRDLLAKRTARPG